MRDILTAFAALLVLLLTVALVGPYVVDWGAHRGLVEQTLSRAFGAPVQVNGPIRLTLLPTPTLEAQGFSVGGASGAAPSLEARSVDVELAIAPLARGALQVIKADFDRPTLRLALTSSGALVSPHRALSWPVRTEIDDLRVRDGRIVVARPGAPDRVFDGLNLSAHADSLAGPFVVTGTKGGALSFRIGAGSVTKGALPFQVSLQGAGWPNGRFNGFLALASARGAGLQFTGTADVAGWTALVGRATPWALRGPLTVDVDGAHTTKASLRIGPENGGLVASVTGQLPFTPGSSLQVSAATQDADGDRFLRAVGLSAPGASPAATLAQALESLKLASLDRPVDVRATAASLTLGGGALTGLRVHVSAAPGRPAQFEVATQAPGDAHLSWTGTYEGGVAPVLRGDLDAGAIDLRRFAQWIGPAVPQVSNILLAAPAHSLSLIGDVDLSGAAFVSRRFSLEADQTALAGSVAYTRAIGDARARLYADVSAPTLELETLPDLSGAAAAARDMDLALSIDAHAIRLAHFGEGSVQLGRVVLRLRRDGSTADLDELSVTDLGGATLRASGRVDGKGAELQASLRANRLVDLADALSRVAPGALTNALRARAAVLAPAQLTLRLSADRAADGTYRPTLWAARGSLRGVRLDGSLTPGTSGVDAVAAAVDAPDASILLRQLGLSVPPTAETSRARLDLRGSLQSDRSFAGSGTATVGDSRLTLTGRADRVTGSPAFAGDARVASADAAPLLRLLSVTWPDLTQSLPVDLASPVTIRAGRVSFSALSGAALGDPLTGDLDLDLSGGAPRLIGSVSLRSLRLAGLAELAFGPGQAPAQGSIWSKAPLLPGFGGAPATALNLRAQTFDLAPGWSGQDARLRLTLAPGEVALRDAAMSLDGGRLTGSLDLRRNGGAASLVAQVQASGVHLVRPELSAVADASGSFAASGASAQDLIAGFAGSGAVAAKDVRIPGAAPQALPRILQQADQQETFQIESLETQLEKDLDAGPAEPAALRFDLEAAGGRLHVAGVADAPVNAAGVFARMNETIDLRNGSVLDQLDLLQNDRPKDWPAGPPPGLRIEWSAAGLGAEPRRSVEADALFGALAARAAARETQRISDIDQDMRERAFFIRRLKGLEFLHRREAEEAAYEADQAKRAREAAEAKSAATAPAMVAPPPAATPPDPLAAGRF